MAYAINSHIPVRRVRAYTMTGGLDLSSVANGSLAGEYFNGTMFSLDPNGARTVILPAPAAGFSYRFILSALLGGGQSLSIVTDSGQNIIYGGCCGPDVATGNYNTASAQDTIVFNDGAEAIGDFVDVWCDGTNWYVFGWCQAASTITFSAT